MSASGLSPRTVRWTHTVLKMALDYAVDDGRLIAKNPATRTKFPPMRATTHIYLTAREVAQLSDACGVQGDVVLILAYTGLRFGELTGLNVEDVDVDARRIRVRRSITQVGGRLVEGNPKSDAGRRSVPIPERLVPALKARLDGRPRALRRSPRRGARGWVWRTGSDRSTGRPRLPKSDGTGCGCTISATHMRRYHAGQAPISACCRKPWGMRPLR
jgi:integrase